MTAPTLSHGTMSVLYGALTLLNEDWRRHVTGPLREKKTAVVLSLLDSGANPSALHQSKYPTWMTNLCNSKTTAIITLIEHGMRLDQRNPTDDSTVLHHWASNPISDHLDMTIDEESSLVVVKLLVEKETDLMARDKDGFTPILKAADAFHPSTSHENLTILDFLLEREGIHRQEKIDALELVGAIILSDPGSSHLFHLAFDYWRRALHLRQLDDEVGPLLKTVIKRKSGLTAAEWITSDELERVIENPSEFLLQSFLVRLRIYSSKSGEVVSGFVDKFFLRSFPLLVAPLKCAGILDHLWAILEMIHSFQSGQKGHARIPSNMVVSSIIGRMLYHLQRENPNLLTADTVQTSLDLIFISEKHRLLNKTRGQNIGLFFCYPNIPLVTMLAGHPELQNEKIECLLRGLSITSGRNLIHMACYKDARANLATFDFLLKFCDPNEGDSEGNGPLHLILAESYPIKPDDLAIVRLLLDSGAHLDRVNNNRKTAVDLWTKAKNRIAGVHQMDRLPDWCYERVPKLMCLSSRVISTHKVPFKDGAVPVTLHKFVEMH